MRVLKLSVLLIMVALKANALDYPHFEINNIGCDSCHFIYGTEPTLLPPWTSHTPQNIDDTQHNTLCWSCHNDVDAPYVRTHSSLQIDNSYGNWTVECRVCHNPHYQKQKEYGSSSYLYSEASTAVTATSITRTGAGWTVDAYVGMVVMPNISQNKYIYEITDNTEEVLTVQGPMNLTKVTTGNTFAIMYGNLINKAIDLSKITITPAKSGSKTTRFFRTTGTKSFADGDATYDGVCEVCHTQTTHFRNGAYGSDPTYTNPLHTNVGTPAGTNCTTCHSHSNGFRHGGGGGTGCGDASTCHGTRESHPTHVGGSGMLSLACSECHNTSSFPLFKDGQNLANTTACNPCHSPGGTYDGVNNANYGVKNNWTSGVYNGSALKAGKEKWCASCHDEDDVTPSTIQGVIAPNVIGDEDGAFTYGTGWGYYKTGHGLSSGSKYPASGGITAGAGKECLECHDKSSAHIDGNARTFDCSNGCDSTEYRISYRLKQVSGQEPMFVPWTQNNANSADRYRLCTQAGCHNSGPFTGSDSNTNLITDGVNRHASHLVMNTIKYPADYDYNGAYNSNITCVNCHNVHGSTRLAMVQDGKLINREPGLRIWYRNDDIVDWNSNSPNPPNPQNLPLSASTGTLLSYNSSTNLCTHCHGGNNLTGEARIPYQSNLQQTPTLDWAGQPGYESDGVNPDSGLGESSFTFKVKYTDTNNDSPTVYQVWIDEDDLDGYEFDEKFAMTAANPGDINLTDGKIYKYSRTLSKHGDNSINYCFTFSDGSAATGAPACGNNQQVLITNNAPSLAWTEETNYSSDGVYPDSGGSGTSFVFRIKYTDKDNEAPSSIQIWVDKDNDATYEENADPALDEKIDMTLVAGGDSNYINGELFEKAVTLSNTGSLKYRFYAYDNFNTATGTPTADSAGTVLVTSGLNAPTLAWTGESGYTADGVDPDSGPQGGHFIFKVKYTDTDNNSPSQIKVWVDGSDTNMTEVDSSDTDYSNGKLYYADITISSTGNRTYTFTAKDSNNNDATGDPTSNNTVTVTNAITVTCPSDSIQTAINNASDGDTILVADGVCSENINYGSRNITIKSVNGAAFTTIQGTGANSPVVTFSGGQTSSAVLDGITIDNLNSGGTNGRGISISNNSSPTIKNSVIEGNSINSGYDGAGIYIVTGGGATIQNTKIGISGNANTARYGSGIYASTTGAISISDSKIDYNTGLFGPGIYLTNVTTTTTITGTSVNNNQSSQSAGGIYAYNSAVSLTNCTLNNNTVGNVGSYDGGGIYLNGASAGANISGSVIKGNSGRNGAGIYVLGSTLATPLSITNSLISGNSGRYGAGIYITGATNASTITNSTITANTTDQGYAGIYTDSPMTMTGSHIDSNTVTGASFDVGGLMLNGASAIGNISNTTFNGNTARNGSGFTVRNGASLTLTGGIIGGNTAYSGGTGAIWVDALSSLNMYKSIVRGNWAGTYGGGIYTAGTTVIENCIITGNITDAQTYSDGGGIYDVGTLTVTNSTIAGNYARRNGGGLNGGGTIKNSIIYGNTCDAVGPQINGSPTVTYSDIEAGYDSGTNIIDSDPKFIDFIQAGIGVPTADGNFHIASNSPAKNAGNNSDAPADDIDGNTRPLTGGDPADMGADEYTSAESESPVVTAFNASSSTSLHIPVTSFTATDNVGVTGHLITTSDTPPSAIGEVWLSSAPATYIASAEGTYTLYPWAKDAAGNVSAVFDSPRTVTVDTVVPSVDSTSPANGATDVALNSTVTINWTENVDCTTVTTSAITISPSGGWTRTSCSGSQAVFTPSGQSGSTVYTVTISTSVKDTSGNSMVLGYQFSYTTVPPTVAAPTIGAPAAESTTSIRWYFSDNAGNEEGFKVHDSSHTVKASSATPDLTYLDETGLTANTQYTRHVHAFRTGEDSLASSNASAYTLPVAPNVTADKTVSTWYSTTDVVFTNAAGFGAGGVQYYRYVWDKNTSYSFIDNETQWSSSTLTKTSTSEGSWYLHVKSYNGDNTANGTQDYGPYNYDSTPLTVSSTTPSNGVTGVSLNSNVTINWSENVDCTTVNTTNITMSAGGWALSSCSGSQAVFTTSGQNNSITYTVTVSTNVKETNGRPMPSSNQFSYTTTDGATNNAPVLDWASSSTACLTEGVRPRTGVINADFEFRVKYSDADNQCANSITVTVNGSPYDLTSNDGASCVTGRVYYRSIVIGTAGDLNYSFAASDGIDTATGTPTSNRTVSIINTAYKVKPSGSSWSGSSWYTDLATAYNAAPASATLLVYPNDNFASATYTGGLYNNGETNRTLQSVCGADLTIISGGAPVISLYQNGGMIIDGFSITGATASDGIYSNGVSFTVKNSKIYSNANGIRLSAANPVNIQNSKIYSNTTLGVNSVNNTCIFNISDSEIYNNGSGAANGAAVSVTGGSTHTITRTSITGNTATGHGAAVYMNAGGITIEDSILNNNTANTGGAIYCMNCTLTIDDSTINNNTATSAGAINLVNASVNANITDTFIQGNEATSSSVGGGAIYMNGGTQNLTNVVLTGNKTAYRGGAIYNGNGYTNCTFCTMSGNYAADMGGAIYLNANYTINLKNSIVYNNDALNGGNYKQIYATSPRYTYIDVYNTLINQAPGANIVGPPDQRCSYENMGGNDTANNPNFVSPLNPASAPTADGNYRLQSGSPAIGAASSSWTVDHDIFGIGRTQGGTYDMGADEYGSPGTDTTKPVSTITAPAGGATISRATQNPYTITGSVTDAVATSGVEVSTDNGSTWHNASTIGYPGTSGTWTYKWTLPANGTYTIRSRATDSSDNIENPGAGNTVTVGD